MLSRSVKKRPRRVLSDDGADVLNLWFIPHFTETLVLYKHLEDDQCQQALLYHLRIVAALHDILQYLCAHARLGCSTARLATKENGRVTADWGGAEGIGTGIGWAFNVQYSAVIL